MLLLVALLLKLTLKKMTTSAIASSLRLYQQPLTMTSAIRLRLR